MKIILCIASLLNLLILHGLCNVLQSFNEEDMISCCYHFICDLNETRKLRQIEEEFSDQVQEILREILKEVFAMEGYYSPEQFELYRVDVCSRKDEERKKVFNDLIVLGGERGMEICMNRFSELCKEFDNIIKKWAKYMKEITESDECRKNEEMIRKPGGQTMFG